MYANRYIAKPVNHQDHLQLVIQNHESVAIYRIAFWTSYNGCKTKTTYADANILLDHE